MNDFLEWINDELNDRGWSQNELARRMGWSSSAVSKTMNQQSKVSYAFCEDLAKAFYMQKEDVLVKAGFLSEKTRTPEGDEIQRIYNELPAEERKNILDFAKWKLQQLRRDKHAQ